MADLPPLTGDIEKDLPPLTGDISKDLGATAGPLAAPARTGVMGTLLGPGGAEARAKGSATLPALLTRALGGEEETAQSMGQMGQSLQRSAVMPWARGAGLLGMGARALQAGGLGAAEGALAGEDAANIGKRAAVGGLLSPVGDVASKAIAPLTSPLRHKMFAAKSGEEVAEWLRQQVPAWSKMKGPRALYEMAREGGQGKLSEAYESAFKAALPKIKEGTTLTLPADLAKRSGFVGAKDATDVAVDARGLLEKYFSGAIKNRDTRREVLEALSSGLPPGVIPDEALAQYTAGKGWIDFATKGGLFKKGEKFDISLAVERLRDKGQETLEKRSMGPLRQIIRGPAEREPIKKTTMAGPLGVAGALAGGVGGGIGGGLLGGVGGVLGAGGGASGGALAGKYLGKSIPVYKNVPEMVPQIAQLRRALLQSLGQRAVSTSE